MRAKSTTQLMADLGIERSYSRPRVSNDNPFSEAQFKTLKYCPQFPGVFPSYESARAWSASFFQWYNHEHRHEGIGFFTPADVYTGRHLDLTIARQRVLDLAYDKNPCRFVRGRPRPPVVPNEVWINRPDEVVLTLPNAPPTGPPRHRGGEGRGDPRGERPRLPLVAVTPAFDPEPMVQRRETRRGLPNQATAS